MSYLNIRNKVKKYLAPFAPINPIILPPRHTDPDGNPLEYDLLKRSLSGLTILGGPNTSSLLTNEMQNIRSYVNSVDGLRTRLTEGEQEEYDALTSGDNAYNKADAYAQIMRDRQLDYDMFQENADFYASMQASAANGTLQMGTPDENGTIHGDPIMGTKVTGATTDSTGRTRDEITNVNTESTDPVSTSNDDPAPTINKPKWQPNVDQKKAMGVSAAFQAADNMLMGDKNFGAQSLAIDTVVHGASAALIKSGNPYAMAAGAALEVGNFITKAGGQTVEGFDVDINSSGYGDLGHLESQANRVWDSGKRLAKLLQNRNEQIQLSLKAQNIAEELQFENEANINSVTNTLMANQQALAGGYDTSLLGG